MIKQYIKLFVLINTFFLFYTLGITWEKSQVDPGAGYYGGFFAWTFLPAMLFFLVLYGCYSYLKTKKIILPNLFLLLFVYLYFFWIFYLGLLSTNSFDDADLILLIQCLPFVGISVFCGLIVKLVLWIKNRITKKSSPKNEGTVSVKPKAEKPVKKAHKTKLRNFPDLK